MFRNPLAPLLFCIGLLAACSPRTEVLIQFVNRTDADGGTVTVVVARSDFDAGFTSGDLPGTLLLRIHPSNEPFTVEVDIEIPGMPMVVCTYKVPAGTDTITIDLRNPLSSGNSFGMCTVATTDGSVDTPDVGPEASAPDAPDAQDGLDGGEAAACASYCDLMASNCPSAYPSTPECNALCRAFVWDPGGPGDQGNDTLACRITWATEAATAQADQKQKFCFYAGASGGDVCGPACENYCAAAHLCPTLLVGSQDDCIRSGCKGPPLASGLPITSGDTLDCRIYQLGLAGRDQMACASAALTPPDGGGACHGP